MRILSLLVLCGLLLAQPVWADVREMEIIADVTGEDPVDAQQKAIDYAKKRAFFLVLLEFEPERAAAIASSMSDAQINRHIRGYQLLQDKMEGNRYLAQYKVSVVDDMVARLVSNEVATDQATNPILVLPVMNQNAELLLWDKDNVWRNIVNGVALERGESLLVMPYGDPTDVSTVSSATVLSSRYEDVQNLAERYGAREVVVALAEVKRDQKPAGVRVTLRRLGTDGLDKRKVNFYETATPDAPADSALPAAARAMVDELKQIAQHYEGEKERRLAEATKLRLQANFRRLKDWVALRSKLEQLPQVLRLDVHTINIASAEATLYVESSPEMMRRIMQANGLAVRDRGKRWAIATY